VTNTFNILAIGFIALSPALTRVAPATSASHYDKISAPSDSAVLVLHEKFAAPDIVAIVQRKPDGSNVIGVKRSALTPDLLSFAVRILSSSVARQGQNPVGKVTVIIRSNNRFPQPEGSRRAAMSQAINGLLAEARRDAAKGKRSSRIVIPIH
jgi:hypothetical protein